MGIINILSKYWSHGKLCNLYLLHQLWEGRNFKFSYVITHFQNMWTTHYSTINITKIYTLYIIFHYSWESGLIHWVLIGFIVVLEKNFPPPCVISKTVKHCWIVWILWHATLGKKWLFSVKKICNWTDKLQSHIYNYIL